MYVYVLIDGQTDRQIDRYATLPSSSCLALFRSPSTPHLPFTISSFIHLALLYLSFYIFLIVLPLLLLLTNTNISLAL